MIAPGFAATDPSIRRDFVVTLAIVILPFWGQGTRLFGLA
jgi:hypothetical protein